MKKNSLVILILFSVNFLFGQTAFLIKTDGVDVYDIQSDNIIKSISTSGNPGAVAVSPDNKSVAITATIRNSVKIIDFECNTIASSVTVGTFPSGLNYSPDGSLLYVCNTMSNNVSVIDVSSKTVINTIAVGRNPNEVCFNPSGTKAYVSNFYSSSISVIDVATSSVEDVISVGVRPWHLEMSVNGSILYCSDASMGLVHVIDLNTNTILTSIPLSNVTDIVLSPNGSYLYGISSSSNSLEVIDINSNEIITSIPVGNYPINLSVTPDGNFVYVKNLNDNTLSKVEVNFYYTIATIGLTSVPAAYGNFISSYTNTTKYPTASNNQVSMVENDDYTFKISDFNYSNTNCQSMTHVKITSLPVMGKLYVDANLNGIYNSGEEVSLNDQISVSDVSINKLKYSTITSDVYGNSYASFTFQVYDGSLFSASDYTLTLDVLRPTWNGNGDWTNIANWNTGTVPSAGKNVLINSGLVTIPSSVSIKNLYIIDPADFQVSSGAVLTVSGDIYKSTTKKLTTNTNSIQIGGSVKFGATNAGGGSGGSGG